MTYTPVTKYFSISIIYEYQNIAKEFSEEIHCNF